MGCLRLHPILYLVFVCSLVAAAVGADTATLSPSKDATLFEDSQGTLANGGGQFFFAGRTNQPKTRRALLAFDVTGAIPAGATITAVTLTLNMSRTVPTTHIHTLHRVLRTWGEGSADDAANEGDGTAADIGASTWLHAFRDTALWETPGGDYAGSASANKTVGVVGMYSWSGAGMVADVQTWLDTPDANFGWMLRGDESSSRTAKRFDSRQHPTAANRPTLTVEFDPLVVNQSPVVANAVADTAVSVGDTLLLALDTLGVFSDPDGDTLTYTATVEGDAVTAVVAGSALTIIGNALGPALVRLRAADETGDSVSTSFTVTVIGVNRPPVVTVVPAAQRLYVGGSSGLVIESALLFSDPDGDTLVPSVTVSEEGIVLLAADAGMIALTGVGRGTTLITITATDPSGAAASTSFTAEVLGVPGDFDDTGDVGFDDFFAFADHFGQDASADNWDATFDLVANGAIDFDDFFTFADFFGLTTNDDPLGLFAE